MGREVSKVVEEDLPKELQGRGIKFKIDDGSLLQTYEGPDKILTYDKSEGKIFREYFK